MLTAQEGQDRLVVRDQRGVYHVLPTREIELIAARDGGSLIHAERGAYPSRRTLTEMEKLLDRRAFMRIHRARIVNRTRIRRVVPLWKGEYRVTLSSGMSVVSGRKYQAAIEEFLAWA